MKNLELLQRIPNQSGASMTEYVLILALALGVFIFANQIILDAVYQRTQIMYESHKSMPGCIATNHGGQLKTMQQGGSDNCL